MPRFYGRHFFLGFTPSSEIDVDLTNAKNNGRDHLQITFTGVRQGLGFGTRRVVDVEVSTMKVILSKNTFDFLDNTSHLFSMCLRIVPGKNVVARGVDRGDCSLAAGFHGYFSISSSQGSFLFFFFRKCLMAHSVCTNSLNCSHSVCLNSLNCTQPQ